jgi:ABC-type nitrate/sulfonate/bicarbonate transport system substrate-binding protein
VTSKLDGPRRGGPGLDRRTLLSRGLTGAAGLAALGGAGALLQGCRGDSSSSGSGRGTIDFQLPRPKSVEFAGQYLADTRGYYRAEGFSGVNLLPGGRTVQQDSIVASRTAFIGISAPDVTGSAIKQGAPIVAIGALYQKSPFCVVSLASNPIRTPQDMIGRKVGVRADDDRVWNAFLEANDLDPSKIEKVPAQVDPRPLVTGEVDGRLSYVTDEPNLLEVKGVETVNFLLDDHRYPLVSQIYVVHTETLARERDKLKALLRADIRGWHDSIEEPEAGAELAAEVYGRDLQLTVDEQALGSRDQNTLIVTDDTKANGLMTVTPELVEASIATLARAGLQIDAEKLFDLSLIEEVYRETPDLKKLPA